jgi:DNA-binding PadR family transcriptional regulator
LVQYSGNLNIRKPEYRLPSKLTRYQVIQSRDLEEKMSPIRPNVEALLPLTPRVFLILWALSENDQHGYRLLSEVEELSRGRVTIKPGSLYEAIQTLEGRGLIAAVGKDQDEGATRQRRTYQLTDLGREALDAEAERLAQLVDDLRASKLIQRAEHQ